MRDPAELYEIEADPPELTDPVMLHMLDGFIDAGSTGRLLVGHLLAGLENRVLARFDVDRLLDYRARRPTMTFASDHWDYYEAPELVLRLVHDAGGTPFLLLSGPEPDREWEAFAAAVTSLVRRFGVRLTVGFHGIPMGVPHTRPIGTTAHATRNELIEGYPPWLDRVQVPGSAASLLELRLGEAERDAVGFAVHVPHYLAQLEYPSASLVALESIVRVTGLSLPGDELDQAAEQTRADIERQVAESEEIGSVVHSLEEQYDTYMRGQDKPGLLAEESGPMPTADELAAEFQRFLAERDGRDTPDG